MEPAEVMEIADDPSVPTAPGPTLSTPDPSTPSTPDPSTLSLRAVLDTVGSIAADLDLNVTLQRIIDAATELAGARYGALGVLDDSTGQRRLKEFVTHGISPHERELIGDPPIGHGVLGVVIDNPEPLRIDDLSTHPLSYGLPANHPKMSTFLGAPIRIGTRVFGNIYLTERHGGGSFTDQDTELIVAFAAAAGVLIENAQLYERMNRRRRWLEAANAVSSLLLGSPPPDRPADVIAEKARSAGEADGVVLLLPAAGSGAGPDGQDLRIAGSSGVPIDINEHSVHASPADVFTTGRSVVTESGGNLLVRVGTTKRAAGVLWIRWLPDRLDRIKEATRASAEAFAEQVGLVLEVARAQDDRARLAVFEDRDRIGRDLHDLVIQRLFAVGLMLENTTRLARDSSDSRLEERIGSAVDQLDETIKDIRRTIFEFANPNRRGDLRDDVDAAIAGIMPSLKFRPSVRFNGAVNSRVTDRVRPHLLAVLGEALSNVGRHAQATSASVTIDVGDEVQLTVLDNGRGIAGAVPGHGLPNMTARAEGLGGSCELQSPAEGGTKLVWRVPAR